MVAFTPGFITCNATYNVGNISDVAGIDDTMIEKLPRICHFFFSFLLFFPLSTYQSYSQCRGNRLCWSRWRL